MSTMHCMVQPASREKRFLVESHLSLPTVESDSLKDLERHRLHFADNNLSKLDYD